MTYRKLGVLPSPPNPGLPEFGTLRRPKSGKPDFGWGGVGGWGSLCEAALLLHRTTPTPRLRYASAGDPPRKGEGRTERGEGADRVCRLR
jgi:hypothetical protein